MINSERKMTPDNARYLWHAIREQKQNPATATKVFKYLTSEAGYKPEEAESALNNAVEDGLLIAVPSASGNSNNANNRASKKFGDVKLYKIPELEDIQVDTNQHDWYCYECHNPSNLINCTKCLRAFHATCKRDNPDKTNDNSKSVVPNRRRLAQQVFDEHSADASVVSEDGANENEDTIPPAEEAPILVQNNIEEEKPILDIKIDSKEVICIGEVRPPSRRRKESPQSCKPEEGDSNSETPDDSSLCTRCRLLERSAIRDPPNMKPEELNYLLRFIFNRIKSWLCMDTFSSLPFSDSLSMPSKKDLEAFSRLCFKNYMSLDKINQKLDNNEYTCLTDFKCDMTDLQHCIGILYGTATAEYEATKYLLSDCDYELLEIRQCRDCYRHSNEKSSPLWFCKPCVPRHELVFAKQIGYSYWPAKVIKVKDNQYDVRFFGGQHSRAIVDGVNVKAIDTDLKYLKVKKTIGFIKAMEELEKHQSLLQLPPGQFSYETEQENVVDLSRFSFETTFHFNDSQTRKPRGRPSTINKLAASPATSNASHTPELNASKRKRHVKNYAQLDKGDDSSVERVPSKRKKTEVDKKKTKKQKKKSKSAKKDQPDNYDMEIHSTSTPKKLRVNAVDLLKKQFVNMKSISAVQRLALETLQSEIKHWQIKIDTLIEEHKKAIANVKKKQWCFQCEEEALYYCCWNTSYCSIVCQQKHWMAEHKKNCRRIAGP